MNVARKPIGIILLLFVLFFPILFLSNTGEIVWRGNGRLAVAANIQPDPPVGSTVTVSDPVTPSISPAVRDLPPMRRAFILDREINPRLNYYGDPKAYSDYEPIVDPLLAVQAGTSAQHAVDAFGTPSVNFDGQGYSYANPPDTVGDIGLTHYIQGINGSGTFIQIYNKDGTTAVPPFALDSLGSGNCANGKGDPIILYDRLADRWLLSEFASSGNQLCVYISQTADPTGFYYAYAFTAVHGFPDYPKYGVWPDAYYIGTNENSVTLYALDRNAMLAGSPAAMQSFAGTSLSGFSFQMLIPSDLDGGDPPPVGSPNYFMRHRDTENHGQGSCPVHAGGDCLEIVEFNVDWAVPSNSSISSPIPIQITEFDSDLCGLSSYNCFPQPGSSTTLDPLREVVMNRLQYRNFGTYETLVGNFVTDVDGTDHGGVRWFELRKSGAGQWALYQEGTYAPDASHRWMGAVAMDGSGNIALGYNVSDAMATYPSLRYTGRLDGDPLNTMPRGEHSIVAGSSPNGSNRYGDYAAMGVDPADDCTFWFTGMYNKSLNWSTRIVAFKFDSCTGAMSPAFRMETTPATVDICLPNDVNYTVKLDAIGGFVGDVSLSTVGAPGTAVFTPITSTLNSSSTLIISDTAVGSYTFDIIGTGVSTPTLVQTNSVTLNAFSPLSNAPTLTFPADAAVNVSTVPTYAWQAVPEVSSYQIDIATDADFLTIIDSATVMTNRYSSAVILKSNTTYYWRVRAKNACGSGAYSVGSRFTTAVALGDCGAGTIPGILYSQDFEDGTDIWTHGGTRDTWAISTERSHSGKYAYYAEDVEKVSNQQLETPDIPLPNDHFPLSLQFWNWQRMEGYTGGCWDGATVEISTNGGMSWTQLNSELLSDPYDGSISSVHDNPLGGMDGWCGEPQEWLNSIVNLNAFAGKTVRFRFSLGTDKSLGREGWYIDDFKVQSCLVITDYLYLPIVAR